MKPALIVPYLAVKHTFSLPYFTLSYSSVQVSLGGVSLHLFGTKTIADDKLNFRVKEVPWGCARDAKKNHCRKAFVCLCPAGLETIWNIVDGDHAAAAALANSRLFKWYRSVTRNPGRDSSTSVFNTLLYPIMFFGSSEPRRCKSWD